jgi:hypothetical protein
MGLKLPVVNFLDEQGEIRQGVITREDDIVINFRSIDPRDFDPQSPDGPTCFHRNWQRVTRKDKSIEPTDRLFDTDQINPAALSRSSTSCSPTTCSRSWSRKSRAS